MFEIYQTQHGINMRMSAILANIDTADDALAEYLDNQSLPIDIFATRILLREGLLNAVAHGAEENDSLIIHFELNYDPKGVTIFISDPGPGFDWKNQKSEPDDLDESGRGLALMKLYADKMTYNQKGNEITLRKYFKNKVAQTGL